MLRKSILRLQCKRDGQTDARPFKGLRLEFVLTFAFRGARIPRRCPQWAPSPLPAPAGMTGHFRLSSPCCHPLQWRIMIPPITVSPPGRDGLVSLSGGLGWCISLPGARCSAKTSRLARSGKPAPTEADCRGRRITRRVCRVHCESTIVRGASRDLLHSASDFARVALHGFPPRLASQRWMRRRCLKSYLLTAFLLPVALGVNLFRPFRGSSSNCQAPQHVI